MANKRLREHYDTRYYSENRQDPEPDRSFFPVSRIGACARFLSRYFKGQRVLELGAGDGDLLDALLAEGMNFGEYTASEFSTPRVERLKARFSDRRVRVLSADAEALPGPFSAGYDAVIMVAVLEHLIDPILALKRVRQLLSPEGFVYIDTPNIAKYTRRAKLLLGHFPATASRREGLATYSGAPVSLHDEGHLHYFTYRSLGRVLSEYCGYSRIVPLAYHCGHRPFGRILGTALARLWPQMFSEIALIAYR